MSMVSIKDLNRADVFRVLYNRAKPQGGGFLHYTPEDMTTEQAEATLTACEDREGRLYFDYHRGRVMKVQLDRDATEFDARLFDRDNGVGAALQAVTMLRAAS